MTAVRATIMDGLNLSELDLLPDRGLIMRGWHFSQAEVKTALSEGRILNPAVELGSNVCPWNCDFALQKQRKEKKLRLANELSFDERIKLIDDLCDLGARTINIVGAGEPKI